MKEKRKPPRTTGQGIEKPDGGTTPILKDILLTDTSVAGIKKPRGGTTEIKKKK